VAGVVAVEMNSIFLFLQVKKKMTKEEFVRNNRGINDSEDLPSEYLCQVTKLGYCMTNLSFHQLSKTALRLKPFWHVLQLYKVNHR
jgi:hypothetical protein